ncbi:hypothetical protein M5D96_011880 [Drosophila gunungcola]|uniref:Uncharacterized protein n=1 Tax=Drosophila gunungcola TaxID=103775 RepID=A0A9Q0BKB4_9MUSC|nr:hypothetical protein M5D96_011880 [Drosophila gunungcola]
MYLQRTTNLQLQAKTNRARTLTRAQINDKCKAKNRTKARDRVMEIKEVKEITKASEVVALATTKVAVSALQQQHQQRDNRNRGPRSGGPGGMNSSNMGGGGGGGPRGGEDFFIAQRLRSIAGPTFELEPIELPTETKFSGRNRLYVDYHINAEKAKRALDGSMRKGRQLRVRFAPNATILRVSNLTPFVSNELLYKSFEIFGPIERASITVDDRGKHTGEGIMPDFNQERSIGPRFADLSSFEHEYGSRWKQLHNLFKSKQDALKRELKMEEDKLEAQMEYARYEQETELLRQELRKREVDNERKKLEWEMREKQAEEMRKREEETMRRHQGEMQNVMNRQEEDILRRQQENNLFMQAQQLNSLLDQQEGFGNGGGGNNSSFDNFGGNSNSPFEVFRGNTKNNSTMVGNNPGPGGTNTQVCSSPNYFFTKCLITRSLVKFLSIAFIKV